MRIPLFLVFTLMALAACQTQSLSQSVLPFEDPIERVRQAYQVDRLAAAKLIRVEDEIRQEYPDHEYGPDFHDVSIMRRHIVLDMKNQRGSSEYLTNIANSFYHGRRILQDGESKYINYSSNNYEVEDERSFFFEYGRTIRGSDTLLALWLVNSAKNVQIGKDEVWMGESHDKLTMDFPESPPLTLLIQKDTGYIAKMTRIVGEAMKVSYTYDRHKVIGGITTAAEHTVFADREKLFYSYNRRVVIDDPADRDAFDIDEGISLEPERVDHTKEVVEQLSDSLHHVGKEDAYSTFIRTEDGLLAFGLQAGFSERLNAYRVRTGNKEPLRYAVATDHHLNELASVAEATQQGATLLVTADALPRSQELTAEVSNAEIETITTPRKIGTVTLFSLPTSHASRVLVGFESTQGILLQMSHWVKIFKDAPVAADFGSYTLYQALEPYTLNPKHIISTESRMMSDWQTYSAQVNLFQYVSCYRSRPICENWR